MSEHRHREAIASSAHPRRSHPETIGESGRRSRTRRALLGIEGRQSAHLDTELARKDRDRVARSRCDRICNTDRWCAACHRRCRSEGNSRPELTGRLHEKVICLQTAVSNLPRDFDYSATKKWSGRWRDMRAAAKTPSRVADPSPCSIGIGVAISYRPSGSHGPGPGTGSGWPRSTSKPNAIP